MTERPYDPSDPLADGPTEDGEELAGETTENQIADLMRADEDPLPDAQVPGAGPDGQVD